MSNPQVSPQAAAQREQDRQANGQFGPSTAPESQAELETAPPKPSTVADVTDDHLRQVVASYLRDDSGEEFDEWAEGLDYYDEDFGSELERVGQALCWSELPGTNNAMVSETTSADAALVDIGVYDEVQGVYVQSNHKQDEFWVDADDPQENATAMIRGVFDEVARQDAAQQQRRDRDSRLATMLRADSWSRMDKVDDGTKRDLVMASYPGLSLEETTMTWAQLEDARASGSSDQARRALNEAQARSDEAMSSQDWKERSAHVNESHEAMRRLAGGPHSFESLHFVGANMEPDAVNVVDHEDEAALRTFWAHSRIATSRPYF